MKQLLSFEQVESKGKGKRKTQTWRVYSVYSGDYLGLIHWRTGWRCYVISYDNNSIDMSLSCNKELNKFMEKLEEERNDINK